MSAKNGHAPKLLNLDELAKFMKENGIGGLAELRDPWNYGYSYRVHDGGVEVGCLGRDGQQGGEGENRDFFMESPGSP